MSWQIPPMHLTPIPEPQQSDADPHFSPTWLHPPPVSTHIGPWPLSRQKPEQHSKPAVHEEGLPLVAVGLHGERRPVAEHVAPS